MDSPTNTPRVLTPEEVKKLGLTSKEKFVLIDKTNQTLFLGSESKSSLEETLSKMVTTSHPKHKDLELAQQ